MATSFPVVRIHPEANPGKRIPGRKPYFAARLPYERQVQRLEQKITHLTRSLEGLQHGLDVSSDPRAVVPERALVLELAAPLKDFELAAQALGFEWLTSLAPRGDEAANSLDEDEDPDEEDEASSDKPAILYVTMPSLEGLRRLLASYKRFKDNGEPVSGEESLFKLFGFLLDLRTWSARDRIDPAIERYIRKMLEQDPSRPVMVEIDLWYRDDRQRRDKSVMLLREYVQREDGQVLDFVEIAPIRYQGILVELPGAVAAKLAEGLGSLPSLDEIMTIRPQSSYAPEFELAETVAGFEQNTATMPLRNAVAVLLDGYPVEQHAQLKGRLVVREVGLRGSDVPPAHRFHGTAMASLVAHGDLAAGHSPVSRQIVMVPILGPHPGGKESTPAHKLPIGVVRDALEAIVQGRKVDAELKEIVVVNHSLCDTHAPFAGRPSPWAAMLDYYSHAHALLFVVSAGNIFDEFHSAAYADVAELAAASPAEREVAILVALDKALGTRGILSPAESVNALTVGALHSDASAPGVADIDPFPNFAMSNLASAVGPGVNRSIKPDVLAHGGRFAAGHGNKAGGGIHIHATPSVHLGQLVASPSSSGDLNRTRRAAGTSNAAALVTRSCILLGDSLDEAFADEGGWIERPTRAVILKALAVHGCGWGGAGAVLEKAFTPQERYKHAARRRKITSVLGYGASDVERVASGAANRITLLGDGTITSGKLHEFRIPLVDSMLSTREVRRITATLAWTTPIVTTTVDYRGVALQLVDSAGKVAFWDGVSRVVQPASTQMRHGTLIHLVLEGSKEIADVKDGRGIFLGVQALARHASHLQTGVPYALAVTVEMAASQQSRLYLEIRDAVRARTRTRATIRS